MCLYYFCYKNGYQLRIPDDEFYKLAKETVMASEINKDITLKKVRITIQKFLVK